MNGDSFGDRMKRYEKVPNQKLTKDFPVIARIDGKAFHTLTRGMERPWDDRLQACMSFAAKYLTENVQGCRVAYWQSDEISLLLTAYETEESQGWFDYKLEKMCSVAASMTTSAFLAAMMTYFPDREADLKCGHGLPAFDARFFNLPKDEVTNYFIWRQKDAIRNSVQMLARANFSHKECNNLNNSQLKQKLLDEKGVRWEDQSLLCQRGACVVKLPSVETVTFRQGKDGVEKTIEVTRNRWTHDVEIPLFTENRDYIDNLL